MSLHTSGRSLVGLAVGFALAAAFAGWWQARILRTHGADVRTESWERVKEDYPPVQEPGEPAHLAPEVVETILRANPFSPQRRVIPETPPGAKVDGGGTAGEPTKPKFVYKGRINLGKRQRAIMEDVNAHKTHFLEVGQEVAGFKVLDIAENRVVLSDLQSKEEVVVSLATTVGP